MKKKLNIKLPVILSSVLITLFIAGSIKIYGTSANDAIAFLEFNNISKDNANDDGSHVLTHLQRMSYTDESHETYVTDEDGEHEIVKLTGAFYPTITTSDGKVIVSPDIRYNDEDPEEDCHFSYLNIIGRTSDIGTYIKGNNTNYLLANYKEELFDTITYNPLTGLDADSNLTLDLNSELQEGLNQYLSENNCNGQVFISDFQGKTLACVSTPTASFEEMLEGSQINKCFRAIPSGSTMKILLTLAAVKQGIDVSNLKFECTGKYKLQYDQEYVKCTGTHGEQNFYKALENSCNCYFSQLAEMLDLQQAQETFKEYGFIVNGEGDGNTHLGKMTKKASNIEIHDQCDFSTVWNLLGQPGSSGNDAYENTVSIIDMVNIINIIATTGEAKYQTFTSSDEINQEEYPSIANDTTCLSTVKTLWETTFEEGFKDYDHSVYSAVKTGTVDKLGNNNRTQKTLMGYSEAYGFSFFIVIEDQNESEITCLDISNKIADIMKTKN